jgi:hypothetical protein
MTNKLEASEWRVGDVIFTFRGGYGSVFPVAWRIRMIDDDFYYFDGTLGHMQMQKSKVSIEKFENITALQRENEELKKELGREL